MPRDPNHDGGGAQLSPRGKRCLQTQKPLLLDLAPCAAEAVAELRRQESALAQKARLPRRSANAAVARSRSWPYIIDTAAIRQILDHLGLSPPEKPSPDVSEVVGVPVDDEGREIGANPD